MLTFRPYRWLLRKFGYHTFVKKAPSTETSFLAFKGDGYNLGKLDLKLIEQGWREE